MKYLAFSFFLFCTGCASYYKDLHEMTKDGVCLDRIQPPPLATAWFDASVDVIGKHISGLLLIKKMPDRSSRLVFTTETGITVFDFEFGANGNFQVKRILHQLDKKPVIHTLQQDFYLLLGFPFKNDVKAWRNRNELYFGVEEGVEKFYFTTDASCGSLKAIESGSRRKRKVSITLTGEDKARPNEVVIKHFTFDMTITLTRIDRDVDG